jgi:hypothetical protein
MAIAPAANQCGHVGILIILQPDIKMRRLWFMAYCSFAKIGQLWPLPNERGTPCRIAYDFGILYISS